MGFLRDDEQDYLQQPIAWKEATKQLLGAKSSSEADLLASIAGKTNFKDEDHKARVVTGLKWRKWLRIRYRRMLFGLTIYCSWRPVRQEDHPQKEPVGHIVRYPRGEDEL